MPERWISPELVKLREKQRRVELELAELERAWSRLDSRGDFRADVERETLRLRLKACYSTQARLVRHIGDEVTRDQNETTA